MISKEKLTDLSYLEARGKLIEIAAFLDRIDRAEGLCDFRVNALVNALPILLSERPDRAQAILEALSDHSSEPVDDATGPALGAPNPNRLN